MICSQILGLNDSTFTLDLLTSLTFSANTTNISHLIQDDVLVPIESVEDLRAVNVKMTEVMNMMQTELNRKKSGYILMGPKEQIELTRKRLKDRPIMCGEFVMNELTEEKWLRDYLT